MSPPQGFAFSTTNGGLVRISHHGRVVTTLAGDQARRFLARADAADEETRQHLMARATGHYKH